MAPFACRFLAVADRRSDFAAEARRGAGRKHGPWRRATKRDCLPPKKFAIAIFAETDPDLPPQNAKRAEISRRMRIPEELANVALAAPGVLGAFFLAAKLGVRQHHWPYGNMPPQPQVTEAQLATIVQYVREMQAANGITYRPHRM